MFNAHAEKMSNFSPSTVWKATIISQRKKTYLRSENIELMNEETIFRITDFD
jgi:hypothetical protein